MRMCGIEQLVGAALVGYNVTVLVYGQTGSGKTFTISGREEAPDEDGYGGEGFRLSQAVCERKYGSAEGLGETCAMLMREKTLDEAGNVGTSCSCLGLRQDQASFAKGLHDALRACLTMPGACDSLAHESRLNALCCLA